MMTQAQGKTNKHRLCRPIKYVFASDEILGPPGCRPLLEEDCRVPPGRNVYTFAGDGVEILMRHFVRESKILEPD